MARVTITQDDMDRSRIINPGKYLINVADYEEQAAGTDGSALYVYQLRVAEGKEKGTIMRYQVSEKAVGMGIEFWEACGAKIAAGSPLDPAFAKGKTCFAFVQRGEYKGKPQNVPVSFAKYESSASTESVKL